MTDYAVRTTTTSDNGGVHINSGIPNRAFYLVATAIGGYAWDAPGHIWYNTLLRLFAKADFNDCSNISLQVAGELFGSTSSQAKAVREAWTEVGVAPATSSLGIPRRQGLQSPPTNQRRTYLPPQTHHRGAGVGRQAARGGQGEVSAGATPECGGLPPLGGRPPSWSKLPHSRGGSSAWHAD